MVGVEEKSGSGEQCVGEPYEEVYFALEPETEVAVGHAELELAEVVEADGTNVHGHGGGAEGEQDAIGLAGALVALAPGMVNGGGDGPGAGGERCGLEDVRKAEAEDDPSKGSCEAPGGAGRHDDGDEEGCAEGEGRGGDLDGGDGFPSVQRVAVWVLVHCMHAVLGKVCVVNVKCTETIIIILY